MPFSIWTHNVDNMKYIFRVKVTEHQKAYRIAPPPRVCVCTEASPAFLQYFIGVTVLAMVPELPEIVNGVQFALQNNISLRYEFAVLFHFQLETQLITFLPYCKISQ